jgi:hypothetical protein
MNWIANLRRTISHAVGAIFQNCKHASHLQSEALDHRLPRLQRAGLNFHLLLCKWCRRYGRKIRFLRVAARQYGEKEERSSPATLSSEARSRILKKLKASDE